MRSATLIREHRKRAGLTQAELARAAGTSQPTIAKYEAGKAEPRAGTLDRILAACGARISAEPGPVTHTHIPARGPRGRLLRKHRDEIVSVIEAAGLSNPRVFGSVARGEDTEASDVDLLVDESPGGDPLRHYVLGEELTLRMGIVFDIHYPQDLKPAIREQAFNDSISL